MTLLTTTVYVLLHTGDNEPDDGVEVEYTPIGGGGYEGFAFINPDTTHENGVTITNKTRTAVTGAPFGNQPGIPGVARFLAIQSLSTRFGLQYDVTFRGQTARIRAPENTAPSPVAGLPSLIDGEDDTGGGGGGDGLDEAQVDARVHALIRDQAFIADTDRWPIDKIVTGATTVGHFLKAGADNTIVAVASGGVQEIYFASGSRATYAPADHVIDITLDAHPVVANELFFITSDLDRDNEDIGLRISALGSMNTHWLTDFDGNILSARRLTPGRLYATLRVLPNQEFRIIDPVVQRPPDFRGAVFYFEDDPTVTPPDQSYVDTNVHVGAASDGTIALPAMADIVPPVTRFNYVYIGIPADTWGITGVFYVDSSSAHQNRVDSWNRNVADMFEVSGEPYVWRRTSRRISYREGIYGFESEAPPF